jgi:hypothetical protein
VRSEGVGRRDGEEKKKEGREKERKRKRREWLVRA